LQISKTDCLEDASHDFSDGDGGMGEQAGGDYNMRDEWNITEFTEEEDEIVRTTGNPALTPFRYQTKWQLAASNTYQPQVPFNIYDYGLRWYHPDQGRFVNRDPIGEAGGINLYAYVGNDPVNRRDLLGLSAIETNEQEFCWYEEETQQEDWDDENIRRNNTPPPFYVTLTRHCITRITQDRSPGATAGKRTDEFDDGRADGEGQGQGAQGEKGQWSKEDCAALREQILARKESALYWASRYANGPSADHSSIRPNIEPLKAFGTIQAIGEGIAYAGGHGGNSFLSHTGAFVTALSYGQTLGETIGYGVYEPYSKAYADSFGNTLLASGKIAGYGFLTSTVPPAAAALAYVESTIWAATQNHSYELSRLDRADEINARRQRLHNWTENVSDINQNIQTYNANCTGR
jgi:RHS repeat-associated protein